MQPYGRTKVCAQGDRSGGAAASETAEVAWGLQSQGHCWAIHLERQKDCMKNSQGSGWLSTSLRVA